MARGGFVVAMLVVLSSLVVVTSAELNITKILEPYPNFSQLSDWFNRTGVADEINNRSSITILAPTNNVLGGYLSAVSDAWTNPDKVADTLRYHVLLTYFGLTELHHVSFNGTQVTTLLQTTGRANQSQGFVTIYNNGTAYVVGHEFADSYGNETIQGNVTQVPYIYSILQVSTILVPVAPAPLSPAPAPSPTIAKAPSPSPLVLTPPTETVPVATTDDSHACGKSISNLLLVLAMVLVSGAALL